MVKVNVSLPEDVLQELDAAARRSRTSRSGFLVQAVKRYLEEREEAEQQEKRLRAAAAIDQFRHEFGGWDGTAEILRWRDRH